MGALAREAPRPHSHTPRGQPHIRVLHIPYNYRQLDQTIEVFKLPDGCQLLDWALDLSYQEWVFVVDLSKEELDDECEYDHTFDFRCMMRRGQGA